MGDTEILAIFSRYDWSILLEWTMSYYRLIIIYTNFHDEISLNSFSANEDRVVLPLSNSFLVGRRWIFGQFRLIESKMFNSLNLKAVRYRGYCPSPSYSSTPYMKSFHGRIFWICLSNPNKLVSIELTSHLNSYGIKLLLFQFALI